LFHEKTNCYYSGGPSKLFYWLLLDAENLLLPSMKNKTAGRKFGCLVVVST
jgi:hypothetical protein